MINKLFYGRDLNDGWGEPFQHLGMNGNSSVIK